MRTLKAIVFILIFLLPAYSYPSTLDSARISLIDGDVQIKTEDTDDWVPASINMPLKEGDRIWVPDGGRLELQIKGGTALRLDEVSSLDILTIESDSAQFYLSEGHAYINFRGGRDRMLQIDTPVSSTRVYDRSSFRVDVTSDGSTDVSVFKGSVEVESRTGKTRVGAAKTLSIGEHDYAELSPLGHADEWERWNIERDKKLYERRYSYRHLPDELEPYSSDFDHYGRWVYVREYGYVWTPTVFVSVGWSPFRFGRWVWLRGDYVWIAYEPWGWVPHHYGRWAFVVSIGWCWVPPARGAVYWSPGYVGWVYTDRYVAWVPLAPGEIYYGYGYYGPNSVNIYNIDARKTVVKNVYKNVYINNAVTVVHRDTFVKGKHVEIKIKEKEKKDMFVKEKINIGRPDIKPEKATFIPVIKEIPKEKQPHEKIKELKVKEIKEKRPLVKEKNRSVMRPEFQLKEMPVKDVREPKRGKAIREEKASAAEREKGKPEKGTEIKGKKDERVREERSRLVPEKEADAKQKKIKVVTPEGTKEKPATSAGQQSRSEKEVKKKPVKEEEKQGGRKKEQQQKPEGEGAEGQKGTVGNSTTR